MKDYIGEMPALQALIDSVPEEDGLIAFGPKAPAPDALRRLDGEIRKIRSDGHLLPHQILILGFRQRQQRILLFLLEQIPAGVVELSKIDTVLCFHPFPKLGVQLLQRIEGHCFHINKNMHRNKLHVTFYHRFPAR